MVQRGKRSGGILLLRTEAAAGLPWAFSFSPCVPIAVSAYLFFSGASLVFTASAFSPAPPSLCETIQPHPSPHL